MQKNQKLDKSHTIRNCFDQKYQCYEARIQNPKYLQYYVNLTVVEIVLSFVDQRQICHKHNNDLVPKLAKNTKKSAKMDVFDKYLNNTSCAHDLAHTSDSNTTYFQNGTLITNITLAKYEFSTMIFRKINVYD